MKIVNLKLSEIRIDGDTQIRASIDQALVDDYAYCMTQENIFPPVIVVFDGTAYWLADGFHRYHAAAKAGRDSIAAEVRNGTQDNALWVALGANKANGARLTNADKAKACKLALRKFLSRSDNDIAHQIGVDQKTVGNHRKEMEEAGKAKPQTHRTGADGRTTNTSRTGRKPKTETAETEEAESDTEQKAESKPAEPPTDRLGHPLPDVKCLRDAFARDPEISELMQAVSAIKGKVLAKAKADTKDVKPNPKDPIWKAFDLSEFVRSIDNARTAIKMVRPHAICPYCWAGVRQDMKYCPACDGKGWTDEFHYATSPREFRESPQ